MGDRKVSGVCLEDADADNDEEDILEKVPDDGDDIFEKVSDDAKDILEKVSDDCDDIAFLAFLTTTTRKRCFL